MGTRFAVPAASAGQTFGGSGLSALLERSAVAARLWVYLEAETFRAGRIQRYALFPAPDGAGAPRHMAPIADMLRLVDKQRRQTVLSVRRACEVIVGLDARYELSVEHAKTPGQWNLVATRRRPALGSRASRATSEGDLGNGSGATWATSGGDLGNGRAESVGAKARLLVPATRATRATLVRSSDVLLQTVLPDGLLQAGKSIDTENGAEGSKDLSVASQGVDVEQLVARDNSIIADTEAPDWKRDAARAHLAQLGVGPGPRRHSRRR
jgi:hypothetical protein